MEWEPPSKIQYTLEATGTPRARPTSTTKAASTGIFARPSWWRRAVRWANCPVRTTRHAAPGGELSAEDEHAENDSTSDRAHAVGTWKTLNSVKISVVKVR